jgi:hypothetical protein
MYPNSVKAIYDRLTSRFIEYAEKSGFSAHKVSAPGKLPSVVIVGEHSYFVVVRLKARGGTSRTVIEDTVRKIGSDSLLLLIALATNRNPSLSDWRLYLVRRVSAHEFEVRKAVLKDGRVEEKNVVFAVRT